MKMLLPTAWPKSLTPQNNEYYIKQFIGDISLVDKDPYGFFYLEVTCPDHLEHPILPIRFDTGQGTKSIYPVGT